MYITQFNNIRKFENNSTTNTVESNSLAYMYYKANNITSVDYTYFSENIDITNIEYVFAYSSVTSINTNSFKYLSNLTTVDGAFKGCGIQSGTIINFSNSPNISSATDFLDNPANYTIIVSHNTVTETTFRNLGYNIIQADVLKFTVNTESTTSGEKITGIPFNMYSCNTNTELYVDWGDNTTSTLKYSSGYGCTNSNSSTTPSTHTYETPGIYHITVTSNNWSDIRWLSTSNGTSSYNYSSSSYARYYCRDLFNKTCISIDTPIPRMYGINYYSSTSSSSSYFKSITSMNGMFYGTTKLVSLPNNLFIFSNITSFYYMFYSCTSLASIPTDLFKYNTAVTTFNNCFSGCTLLTSIPTNLFKYNTAITSFASCFAYCSSLTLILTDLFKYNTEVTSFASCFEGCSSLTTIPTDLFKYNTKVTTFNGCFAYCSSLTTIPTDLFKYNTAVTNFGTCFMDCTLLNDFTIHIGSILVTTVTAFVTNKAGTTRTVYVPAGSTTKTSFDSISSSLGLAIIAE